MLPQAQVDPFSFICYYIQRIASSSNHSFSFPMLIIIHVLLAIFSIVFLFFLARLLLYRTALIHAGRKISQWIDDRIHVYQHFCVPEFNEYGQYNNFYRKVQLYVKSMASLEDSDFTNLFSADMSSNDIILRLDDDQLIRESFLSATICWINRVHSVPNTRGRCFLLKVKRKDKRRILQPYLQHIHTVVDDIERRRAKEIKLFMNNNLMNSGYGRWRCTPFRHSSTLDTMVMEPDLKAKVRSDLDTFLKSKEYYQKLGRIWKRSYLLYGAAGTGKSSFIAAMANYLSYDIYDIDLNRITDDSDLKMLLLQTTSKSIIAIEDLDRFVNEKSTAAAGFSMSGMLNFMDGIVNPGTGDERIFVFTMNNKDGVDSAILRPGRIDVHIHFPLCDFNSFKTLANNYLGVKEHKLFPHVQEMFKSGSTMSPAEIGELMLIHRSSPSRAIKSVINALQSNYLKIPRRSTEISSARLPQQSTEEYGNPSWKEIAPAKELRRFYGYLKFKSSKRLEPVDRDAEFTDRSTETSVPKSSLF